MDTILEAISTVGFPIAMCVALLYNNSQLSQKHKEETEAFTNALNENTLVLQKLCDKLDVERG